jgi:hypothetical protein
VNATSPGQYLELRVPIVKDEQEFLLLVIKAAIQGYRAYHGDHSSLALLEEETPSFLYKTQLAVHSGGGAPTQQA